MSRQGSAPATRTHLVTGAGSGIGAALAGLLRERGESLLLLARSPQRAEQLQEMHPGSGTLVADLSDPQTCEQLSLPDTLDSVVHAAGVVDLGRVAALDLDTWRDHLTVNLLAPAALTRRALPALREARGTAVFVNSGQGLQAKPDWSAYAASKHGLRALADSLRAEEAGAGVRVTSVFPGRTATVMQERVHAQEGKEYDPADWAAAETVAATILHVLDLPADAVLPEVVVQPR